MFFLDVSTQTIYKKSRGKYVNSSQWLRHSATSMPSLLVNSNFVPLLETIIEETESELIQFKKTH